MVCALLAMNPLSVVVVSYFMFGERLTRVKFLAMALLIGSVLFVSLFKPHIEASAIEEDRIIEN